MIRVAVILFACLVALGQTAPMKISWQEARKNLVSEEPVIHVAGRPLEIGGLPFVIVIDTSGRVRSAEPRRSRSVSAQTAREALSLISALQYRPFLRDGTPVEVQVDEYVRILPPEKIPAVHVPFPPVEDLKSVDIWLKREPCFGACPVYDVHIGGDGVVTLVDKPFDGLLGAFARSAPPEAVRRLIESFRSADFFSLDDRYEYGAEDLATVKVGIRIGEAAKSVVDYGGELAGMPAAVKKLERKIDEVFQSVRNSGMRRQ